MATQLKALIIDLSEKGFGLVLFGLAIVK